MEDRTLATQVEERLRGWGNPCGGVGRGSPDNTLIRVGLDLVLQLADTLPGLADEEELRGRTLDVLAGRS